MSIDRIESIKIERREGVWRKPTARRRVPWKCGRQARGALGALCVLMLGGCLSLGTTNELAVYGINLDMPKRTGQPVTWQLLVDVPAAAAPVASQRIVLKPGDRAFGVFEKSRWTDRAPELFQALLIEGFEDSGRVVGVGRVSSTVGGDIALIGELRSFEAEFPDSGQAHVRIVYSAKLVNYSSSRVLTARVFEQRVPSAGRDLPSVVAAFERGINAMVPEVIDWSLDAGDANWQAAYPQER